MIWDGLNEIKSTLDSFNTIPLYKMNKVGLMNRTDIKYVFSVKILPSLLTQLIERYSVMEILQEKTFQYSTTYLDTPEFLFYHQHMTGKLERFKIRFRKYESSGVSYLEIKKRTNKRRTEKVRIVHSLYPEGFDYRAQCFIRGNTPYNLLDFKPVLENSFTRTTLVDLKTNERITFDFDLRFSDLNGKKVGLPYISIAELKKEGFSNQSYFIDITKKFGIRPTGFSKYCIGNHYLREMPRHNLLKPKILLINRIENDFYKPPAT